MPEKPFSSNHIVINAPKGLFQFILDVFFPIISLFSESQPLLVLFSLEEELELALESEEEEESAKEEISTL